MHSRPILVTPVEDKERVRFSKEIFFVQLVGTELHGGYILGQQQQFIRMSFSTHAKSVAFTLIPTRMLHIFAFKNTHYKTAHCFMCDEFLTLMLIIYPPWQEKSTVRLDK